MPPVQKLYSYVIIFSINLTLYFGDVTYNWKAKVNTVSGNTKEFNMSFKVGNTAFGFTKRVPDSDEATVDGLLSDHAKWMSETHSLKQE